MANGVTNPIQNGAWTDQKTELLIAQLLRFGVLAAATVVLVGGAIFLERHGLSPANYRVFAGEPTDLKQWRGIIRAALALQGRGIIQLGLLLLLLTPVARVLFSVLAFLRERDWLYVGVSSLVFLILLYSMAGSGL
jgi:uncharacterized membrane protein